MSNHDHDDGMDERPGREKRVACACFPTTWMSVVKEELEEPAKSGTSGSLTHDCWRRVGSAKQKGGRRGGGGGLFGTRG
jgi:hypothetical protein